MQKASGRRQQSTRYHTTPPGTYWWPPIAPSTGPSWLSMPSEAITGLFTAQRKTQTRTNICVHNNFVASPRIIIHKNKDRKHIYRSVNQPRRTNTKYNRNAPVIASDHRHSPVFTAVFAVEVSSPQTDTDKHMGRSRSIYRQLARI